MAGTPRPGGTGVRSARWSLKLLWRGGLAALVFGAFAAPESHAAPTAPAYVATSKAATVVMGATHYLDAGAFLEKYGLQRTWLVPARRARFARGAVTLELEADKREISFNGLRLFLGDGVVLHRNGLWVSRVDAEKVLAPLLRPQLFAGTARVPKIIAVDAGHGGRDSGTSNRNLALHEKTLALDVARRVGEMLEREGYQVVMTRTDDQFIPLAERAEIANRAKADLFVSIHFNAAVPEVRGAETYVLTPQHQRSTGSAKPDDGDRLEQPGNAVDPWNTLIGYHIHRHLIDQLETADRGLKRARFVVLRLAECPAVLVEAGYLSNDAEAKRIATPAFRAEIAEAITNGILAYAAQVQAARKP